MIIFVFITPQRGCPGLLHAPLMQGFWLRPGFWFQTKGTKIRSSQNDSRGNIFQPERLRTWTIHPLSIDWSLYAWAVDPVAASPPLHEMQQRTWYINMYPAGITSALMINRKESAESGGASCVCSLEHRRSHWRSIDLWPVLAFLLPSVCQRPQLSADQWGKLRIW